MTTNKTLQNLFKLSSKVSILVPATINIDEEIDNTPFVEKTAALLAECFGGSTSSQALGYWKTAAGELVKEKTTIVYAYCKESDLQNNIEKIIDHAEQLKKDMSQEAIALEINGEMYFI